MTELTSEERYKTISKVNWICTAIDTFLSALKLTIGLITRSPGLIADGLHSLSDLATDVLALILGKLAQHGPDDDHPYGHARYETIGTAILGTALLIIAFGIGLENVLALIHGETVKPKLIALITVAVSVISKEALFHYTMKYARITRSNLLEANAWHSRSDSLSSVVVFVGIVCSMLGFPIVEYLAAIGVAVLIGKMGGQLAYDAIQDLIDRGVSVEQQQNYIETIRTVTDIIDVHMLRSRLMGSDVYIDAHVQVAPTLSVSEAHQINDYTTNLVKSTHTEITDITLHIDFEPDHLVKKTLLDPKRKPIEEALSAYGIENYKRIYLHYADNKVNVEILFGEGTDLEKTASDCNAIAEQFDWVRKIDIYQVV